MKIFFIVIIFSLFCTIASADLYINSGETLIYDDVLDITWMVDVNYVVTSGYVDTSSRFDKRGYLTWNQASTYVEQLDYAGISNWRLPSDSIQEQTYAANGELGTIYYTYLGNVANESNLKNSLTLHDATTVVLSGLQDYGYWTGDSVTGQTRNKWIFNFSNGASTFVSRKAARAIWPIFDGNITNAIRDSTGTLIKDSVGSYIIGATP